MKPLVFLYIAFWTLNKLLPMIWKLKHFLFKKGLRVHREPIVHILFDFITVFESFSSKRFFHGHKQKIITGGQIWTVWRVAKGFPVHFVNSQPASTFNKFSNGMAVSSVRLDLGCRSWLLFSTLSRQPLNCLAQVNTYD